MIEITQRAGIRPERKDHPKGPRPSDTGVSPAKLFDDVYYVGRRGVGVFVIDTKEGLVMIDSMDPCDAAEEYIIPGLKELGFDPNTLNTVLLTHGHFDHFAGAKHLQDQLGAKIALGFTDSAYMVCSEWRGRPGIEFPKIDIVLQDRKALQFGDHVFIPVLSPGHTPGGMSFIFNVHDNGEEHWVSLMSGNGLPLPVYGTDPMFCGLGFQIDLCGKYLNSIFVFEEECRRYECDVVLGVHPGSCKLFEKLEILKDRKQGDPNPFVIGKKGVMKFLKDHSDMAVDHMKQYMDEVFNIE